MKTLHDYVKDDHSKVLKRYGAFFAFSNQRFAEQKKPGITYVQLATGLICNKGTVKQLKKDLEAVTARGIKQDIAENGIKNIIYRELANYECQISGDITDCVYALAEYGITEQQIKKEYGGYHDHCVKNDYF